MGKTGVVWEPIYTEHDMGNYHPESPARLKAVKEVLDDKEISKDLKKIPARSATKEEIGWIHDRDYIDHIEKTRGRHVQLDPDTSTSPKSYDAALMAVGGVIEATEAVLSGRFNNAYAFVRPPGHHAERYKSMGFCLFNNIAIAAEYAIRRHGLKKIAIVDFDVHHGNGTQNAFYKRSDVLYISTHRWPFYPGTGSRDEHGEGEGQGYTLNIPFRAGAGDPEFKKVYTEIVFPILREYSPELIMVSAGYDAHMSDPLGGMDLSLSTYDWITEELVNIANECCSGKIVFVLEGGYSLGALKECVAGALKILGGENVK